MSQGTGDFHTIFRLAGAGLPERFMLVLDGADFGSGKVKMIELIGIFSGYLRIESSGRRGAFGVVRTIRRARRTRMQYYDFINLIWGIG